MDCLRFSHVAVCVWVRSETTEMSGFVNVPTIFSVNTFCCNHNNKKSLGSQSPTTTRQMFHQNEQRNESTPSLSSEWGSETPSLPLWPPHHSRRFPLFALGWKQPSADWGFTGSLSHRQQVNHCACDQSLLELCLMVTPSIKHQHKPVRPVNTAAEV